MVGLQRLSVVPLLTKVMPVDEALASEEPAILISADGWKYDSVTLPVSSRDRSLTLVGLGKDDAETTLTLNKDIRFGSLQTVFDGRRSLLVATSNGAPAQLDDLLRRLSSDPRVGRRCVVAPSWPSKAANPKWFRTERRSASMGLRRPNRKPVIRIKAIPACRPHGSPWPSSRRSESARWLTGWAAAGGAQRHPNRPRRRRVTHD